jgi:hypothetical protein
VNETDPEWRRALVALRIAAAALWVGLFSLYVKVWIEPHQATGELQRWAQGVVDGRAVAPYQFRFLAPYALIGMHDHLGVSVGRAEVLLDGLLIAIGVLGFDRLFRRLGLTEWLLPAALYGCFLGIGILWWGKFETTMAFAALTWACLALADRRARAGLLVTVPILLVCRTDLVAALGLAFVAAWWLDRRRRDDLILGLVLGGLAVGATVAFSRIWPDAHYGEQGLVQLLHNVKPAVWLTAAGFLLPVLIPLGLCRAGTRARTALDRDRSVVGPLLALVVAQVAFTIVVGRIEEVRMFFPLAAPLAVVGVLGWRAVLASRPPAPSSSAVAATQGSDGVREGSAADGADPDRAPSLAT